MNQTSDFDLDDFIAFAEASTKVNCSDDPRYSIDLKMVMELSERPDAKVTRVYKQCGGAWVLEIKYGAVTYVYVSSLHDSEEQLSATQKLIMN